MKVRNLLNRCRQTLGWSGKNMEKHLQEVNDYEKTLAVEHQREEVEQQDHEFLPWLLLRSDCLKAYISKITIFFYHIGF